jgi:formylmethanofuran dehydrogenase subunit E
MKHATVTRDGYEVPLIGIPPEATLQACDRCNRLFPLREVELTDRGILCKQCREETDQ